MSQGRKLATGISLPEDQVAAAKWFDAACGKGDLASCVELAGQRLEGLGVAFDAQIAAGLLERACRGGQLEGCTTLGKLLLEGDSLVMDQRRAVSLLAKACYGNQAAACLQLKRAYEGWDDKAAARGFATRLQQIHQRRCQAGFASGCGGWASSINDTGKDTATQKRVDSLLDRACSLGASGSCYWLSSRRRRAKYTEGMENDPEDIERANKRGKAIVERQCRSGDLEGCERLYSFDRALQRKVIAQLCQRGWGRACRKQANSDYAGSHAYKPKEDPATLLARANPIFARACKLGGGCDGAIAFALGRTNKDDSFLYPDPLAWPGTQAIAKAPKLVRLACDNGDGVKCGWLGLQARRTGDAAKAFALLVRGCLPARRTRDAGGMSREACLEAANMALQGKGTKRDEQRAAELYQLGCYPPPKETIDRGLDNSLRGSPKACIGLGNMYRKGTGVARNLGLAAALYAEACDSDSRQCGPLARAYQRGEGVPRHAAMAQWARKATKIRCKRNDFSCRVPRPPSVPDKGRTP